MRPTDHDAAPPDAIWEFLTKPSSHNGKRPFKILVAEDSKFYRQVLTATLEAWGYEVVAVEDGAAAWKVLQEKDAPRIAILDWLMPGMTGTEVCRRVRDSADSAATYLIILTVRDSKEDLVAALKSGADDYLTKPFDKEELRARLQVGLRIANLQEKLSQRVDSLENALSKAQKLEAIGQLAGGIAHDFNNILTIVSGFSELLLSNDVDREVQQSSLQMILEAAHRGTGLTRQLLAFARKQVLRPISLNLNQSVTSVCQLVRRLLGENVEVLTKFDPALGMVEADPGQIEQVLMNLLINARDALPCGGRITITTSNVEAESAAEQGLPPGEYCAFDVTDNGIGMDARTQAHLFEPFFTTKEVGKGTGLGLATVYGIVRQSGGFIRVQSAIGSGTTFRVFLPRTRKLIEQPAPEEAAPRGKTANETILVIEDEEHVRKFVATVLAKEGYAVLEAANGEDALRLSKEYAGQIHLTLTDVVMPGIDGYRTGKMLGESRPETRVIYMSGYSDLEIHRHHKEIVRLDKPLELKKLLNTVRLALQPAENGVLEPASAC